MTSLGHARRYTWTRMPGSIPPVEDSWALREQVPRQFLKRTRRDHSVGARSSSGSSRSHWDVRKRFRARYLAKRVLAGISGANSTSSGNRASSSRALKEACLNQQETRKGLNCLASSSGDRSTCISLTVSAISLVPSSSR